MKRDVKPQYTDEDVENAVRALEKDFGLDSYPVELVWYDYEGIRIELYLQNGKSKMSTEDARDFGYLLTDLADAVEELNDTYFRLV